MAASIIFGQSESILRTQGGGMENKQHKTDINHFLKGTNSSSISAPNTYAGISPPSNAYNIGTLILISCKVVTNKSNADFTLHPTLLLCKKYDTLENIIYLFNASICFRGHSRHRLCTSSERHRLRRVTTAPCQSAFTSVMHFLSQHYDFCQWIMTSVDIRQVSKGDIGESGKQNRLRATDRLILIPLS